MHINNLNLLLPYYYTTPAAPIVTLEQKNEERRHSTALKDNSSATSVRENMIARKSLRFVALSSTTMRTVISTSSSCNAESTIWPTKGITTQIY